SPPPPSQIEKPSEEVNEELKKEVVPPEPKSEPVVEEVKVEKETQTILNPAPAVDKELIQAIEKSKIVVENFQESKEQETIHNLEQSSQEVENKKKDLFNVWVDKANIKESEIKQQPIN